MLCCASVYPDPSAGIGKGSRDICRCCWVKGPPTESDRLFKLLPKVPDTHHDTQKCHIASGTFRTIADEKVEWNVLLD